MMPMRKLANLRSPAKPSIGRLCTRESRSGEGQGRRAGGRSTEAARSQRADRARPRQARQAFSIPSWALERTYEKKRLRCGTKTNSGFRRNLFSSQRLRELKKVFIRKAFTTTPRTSAAGSTFRHCDIRIGGRGIVDVGPFWTTPSPIVDPC